MSNKIDKRNTRKLRIRSRLSGTGAMPRISVFRSNMFIYAQIIDDEKKVTLASAKGKDANKVGEELAKAALTKKIKKVVFDRNGYAYHGKVKALAEAARKGGLEF